MKTTKQASSISFTAKRPNKHLKQIIPILILVVFLPLLALAARLATNLTPKAFLPSSIPVCRKAVTQYSFDKKCSLANNPNTMAYRTINYTCLGGFKGTYESKTCLANSALLEKAQSICTEHTLVASVTYDTSCNTTPTTTITPQPTTPPTVDYLPQQDFNPSQSYRSVRYTCADGFTGTYTSPTCQTSQSLYNTALSACKNHSICPTISPTTTRTITPSPPTTITPTGPITTITLTPTVTGSTGRPTIMIPPPVSVTDEATNRAPVISTTSLPVGYVNTNYNATIDATDYDHGDSLNMTISGLPYGLGQGACGVPVSGGRITCYINGTPTSAGIYTVRATVTDSQGAITGKTFSLTIYEGIANPNP